MHPLDDAASSFSATPAEGSRFEPLQQEEDLGGAAAASSSPPSRSRGTRAGREENAGIRCQDSQQCSERQQTLAAVDVEPMPVPNNNNKRPRRTALPSVAATPTTTSSVDQPMLATTVLERFSREVSLDAVFRRVRLGGGPEAPEEVAYYTTVTIAGHVFRGVLYDAGPGPHSGSTAASDTDGSAGEGSSLSTAGDDGCLDLALGL